jgi:serine phosphatase RsbU (regulator of sigma subunit)
MLEDRVRTRPSVHLLIKLSAAALAGLLVTGSAAAQGPPQGSPPGQAKKLAAAVAPVQPKTTAQATAPGRVKRAAAGRPSRARPVTAQHPAAAAKKPIAVVTTPAPATGARTRAATTRRKHARRARAHRLAHASTTRAPTSAGRSPARAAAPGLAAASVVTAQRRPARRAHSRTAAPAARVKAAPAPSRSITRTITRGVSDIVEVFPTWAKALIGALIALLAATLALAAVSAIRNRRLRKQRAVLLEEVGLLQAALLPLVPERMGALAVSVAYRPAEGIAAGGDFYDVFPLEHDCVGIIVGDVSGHGREALGPATFIRHMVRSYLEAGLTPRAALQLAGNVLDDQNRDDFATIAVAVHDPNAGTMSFASAGHPPPIVIGPAPFEPVTVASSPPAGVGVTTGMRQTTLALPPGTTVCFFTDGLTEARSHSDGMFGRASLEEVIRELPADASANDVVERVARSSDGFRDDAAVCMLRVVEGAAAGRVRVEEIEVTLSDLNSERLRRFFEACGVRPSETAGAIKTAAPHLAALGSVLIRVRMAFNRSGVDVVPVASSTRGAQVVAVGRGR